MQARIIARSETAQRKIAVQKFDQEFLKPGNYRIGGALRRFTSEDLGQYAAGTNRAIAAGLHIPVLTAHATPNAKNGGPQVSRSALDTVGWLTHVDQLPDGTLSHRLEITDATAAKKIRDKSVLFTSPELAEGFRDGTGRDFGRIIRHTAMTPKPRNPDQGPFEPASCCFSLDDFEEETMPKTDPARAAEPQSIRPGHDTTQTPPTQFAHDDEKKPGNPGTDDAVDIPPADPDSVPEPNPDSPPDPGVDQVRQAIVDNLAAIGVMLPEDWEPTDLPVLLAALKTKAAAVAEAETEEVEDPVAITEEPGGVPAQFSEREVKLQAEIDDLKSINAMATIETAASGMPKAFADRIVPKSVTFAEDGTAEKTFNALEVLNLVRETIPEVCQLSEDDVKEVDPPTEDFFEDKEKKDGHVSDDRARETFLAIHPELRPKTAAAAV